MSGHSKWATTKHKKAVIDSRRAKNFAKLIKAIEVASRNGGPDMDGNPTLFDAVAKAKKNSMPADNIERAIKRGAGLESGGANWETIMYEGYGPAGVAIMIECLSDDIISCVLSLFRIGSISASSYFLSESSKDSKKVKNIVGNVLKSKTKVSKNALTKKLKSIKPKKEIGN